MEIYLSSATLRSWNAKYALLPLLLWEKSLSSEISPYCVSPRWGVSLFVCFFVRLCLYLSYPPWCSSFIFFCRQRFIQFWKIFGNFLLKYCFSLVVSRFSFLNSNYFLHCFIVCYIFLCPFLCFPFLVYVFSTWLVIQITSLSICCKPIYQWATYIVFSSSRISIWSFLYIPNIWWHFLSFHVFSHIFLNFLKHINHSYLKILGY